MYFEQVRSATTIIDYNGVRFLTDPWLQGIGEMGTMTEWGFTVPAEPRKNVASPMVALPKPESTILKGVDAYIVTHVHPDHIDMHLNDLSHGGEKLDKDTKMFIQDEEDEGFMERSGFKDIQIVSENGTQFEGVTLYKTPGRHGEIEPSCHTMGVILKAENEPTVYIVGDTIYFEGVEETLKKYNPDIIITNNCAANTIEYGRLIMDSSDTIKIHEVCPEATIIASHMGTVGHLMLTREQLRGDVMQAGCSDSVLIPADGEYYIF